MFAPPLTKENAAPRDRSFNGADISGHVRGMFLAKSRPSRGKDALVRLRHNPECLNMEWFRSRAEAKIEIERWRKHYNEVRPHSSLGYQTPAAFARALAGAPSAAAGPTGRAAALTRGSAPRPVDQPSRMGHEGKADLADVSS